MSSGIYAALSGAISKMQAVEVVSNNLSNVNTAGYKKDRLHFASVLDAATQTQQSNGMNYTYVPETVTDFTEGVMESTSNDLDVAIDGDGFFKINRDGLFYYTRLGNFDRAADGTMVTRTGDVVLSENGNPIVLPEGPISIDEAGSILAAEGEVGKIGVFDPDINLLEKRGNGQFYYSGNDTGVRQSDNGQVMQRYLERSNVKSMEETVIMMTSLRAFESYQKAMKNYYTIDAKADEIGSL
ncbi:MAG: flagellar basal-body rod protein FlgF [Desulfobacteraceae bacterium 4572_35.2]|nr:MAG: flagellar basal-body rod protein FlgF [Desulfobacteraceae bacterium 4572_35.2]